MGTRRLASASRSARYASSVSRLTLHTPFFPILSAGRSPERMSVYTWVTVTLRMPATSAGFRSGAGRSSTVIPFASVAGDSEQLNSVASERVSVEVSLAGPTREVSR